MDYIGVNEPLYNFVLEDLRMENQIYKYVWFIMINDWTKRFKSELFTTQYRVYSSYGALWRNIEAVVLKQVY